MMQNQFGNGDQIPDHEFLVDSSQLVQFVVHKASFFSSSALQLKTEKIKRIQSPPA